MTWPGEVTESATVEIWEIEQFCPQDWTIRASLIIARCLIILREDIGLTVDPATVPGSEESNDTGDIVWRGATPERAVISHELLDLVRRPVWSPAGDVMPSVLPVWFKA